MAKRKKMKKSIEQYQHAGKERSNNPPVGLVTPDAAYDGRSPYPNLVTFSMANAEGGWKKLAGNLKVDIDRESVDAYKGTESLSFEGGKHVRIAVKIVDDRGVESLKVVEIQSGMG